MMVESAAEEQRESEDDEDDDESRHSRSLSEMLSSTLEGLARAMQAPEPENQSLLGRVPLSELFKELLERNKLRAAVALAEDEPECLFVADDDGWMLLHHLLSDGELDSAQAVLQRGASARAVTRARQTVFHMLAGTHGDELEACRLIEPLHAAGAELNDADEEGTLPLEDAADSGNWTVFQAMLDRGADIRKTRLTEQGLLEEPGVRANAGLTAKVRAAFRRQPA
jgi:ankyrin repeat protein